MISNLSSFSFVRHLSVRLFFLSTKTTVNERSEKKPSSAFEGPLNDFKKKPPKMCDDESPKSDFAELRFTKIPNACRIRRRLNLVVSQQEKNECKLKDCNFGSRRQQGFLMRNLVEDYSNLLLLLHMVNILCEMLLTIMTPVVQVSDVPDPMNKKSPGSGQKIFLIYRHL